MNAKFFVPYETAKALKAAGYPQNDSDYVYYNGELLPRLMSTNEAGFIASPTYHEAVDWLEGKGVLIDCTCGYDYDTKKEWYRCFVIQRERRLEDKYISKVAPTREEALNAAILAALEGLQ